MRQQYKIQLGYFGEKVAQKYYENKGYKLAHKNFRSKHYEIDLIFVKDGSILFVEVKTRTYSNYTINELISNKKLQSVKTAIYLYLQQNSFGKCENWDLELFALDMENRQKPRLTIQPLLRGFG